MTTPGNTCKCSNILPCRPQLISETQFAVDLFNYVLHEYDVHWKISDPIEDCFVEKVEHYPHYRVTLTDDVYRSRGRQDCLFTKEMGDVIMFQLLRNHNMYKRLRGAMFPDGYWSLKPLSVMASSLFRAGEFMPQFLVFCAYTCHMCVYCVMSGRCFRMVLDLVHAIAKVFCTFEDLFKEEGGWKMLKRFASRMANNTLIPKAA